MAALYAVVRLLFTLAHVFARWRSGRADARLKATTAEMAELEAVINKEAGLVMPMARHMLRAAKQAQRLQELDESKDGAASKALRLERWENRFAWLRAKAGAGGSWLPYLLGHADTALALIYQAQASQKYHEVVEFVMTLTKGPTP